jgi:soluble lytic murein transglycosylase-like protein
MTTEEVQNLVINSASSCGLDPVIAFYQIQRESGFNPRAVGAAGEKGIAQFMPATWQRFGSGPHDNAFDPRQAMQAYCQYMTYLLGLFGQNYEKALQGYNGGEGNVQKGTVSTRAQAYAKEILAQARAQSPDLGPIIVAPGNQGGFPIWLIIGAAGVLLYFALSD